MSKWASEGMKITLVLGLVDLPMLVARSLAKNRTLQLVESRRGLSCRDGDEVTGVRRAGSFPLLRVSSPEDEGSTTEASLLTYTASGWLSLPGTWVCAPRDRGCAEGTPRQGVAAWTAGPGSLEVLSMRLLTEKPRLRLVVHLWEQVTVPGFSESYGQGSCNRRQKYLPRVKNRL